MTSDSTTSNSAELQVLLSRVSTLVQMSLDMAKIVVDVQHRLPLVLAHHVDEALAGVPQLVADHVAAQASAPDPESRGLIRGIPITPSALELLHPPGLGDDLHWHVVLVGREPGIYLSVTSADEVVKGIRNASRRRKDSRAEALTYYRVNYEAQKVEKWVEDELATPTNYLWGRVSTLIFPFLKTHPYS
ncbi:hypothetical protein C8J57DRAFT_1519317 [Mycena rebaudengoi]|nr:hypothetical protein C8J57DRAFT_1519317 [Mycena rebaudengoi]